MSDSVDIEQQLSYSRPSYRTARRGALVAVAVHTCLVVAWFSVDALGTAWTLRKLVEEVVDRPVWWLWWDFQNRAPRILSALSVPFTSVFGLRGGSGIVYALWYLILGGALYAGVGAGLAGIWTRWRQPKPFAA